VANLKSLKPVHSYLFVPATRSDRFEKARQSSANVVIVDLEDSVGEGEKKTARDAIEATDAFDEAFVRVNAVSTEHFESDVRACLSTRWVTAIVLPMVESVADVALLQNLLTREIGIVALIESAQGILAADEIAACGPNRLMFGTADYSTQMQSSPSHPLFNYPRSRLVVASVAAGLPAPVDGPTLNYQDEDTLRTDLEVARSLGMGGKLCIHPSQLSVVNEYFRPGGADLQWAKEVVAAADDHHGEVFSHNGEMIDAPVLARARGILRR
jgi:citrate lyase subunit beta / citryl-CoA lyase